MKKLKYVDIDTEDFLRKVSDFDHALSANLRAKIKTNRVEIPVTKDISLSYSLEDVVRVEE